MYTATSRRLNVEPVQALLQQLDIWAQTEEALTSIDLKGNSQKLYHNRLGDKDMEAILHALEVHIHTYIHTYIHTHMVASKPWVRAAPH